ncbi:MAG: hypothetical protein H0V52_05115 [Acidimicrobiia bacterium]|jgi:hypothetical protein|nr:hypothetical protein [Acidimicrobiia bacterium]
MRAGHKVARGRSVEIVGEPQVDEDARTATVPITLDGRRQDFQLSFVPADGGDTWLIDGPRPS